MQRRSGTVRRNEERSAMESWRCEEGGEEEDEGGGEGEGKEE